MSYLVIKFAPGCSLWVEPLIRISCTSWRHLPHPRHLETPSPPQALGDAFPTLGAWRHLPHPRRSETSSPPQALGDISNQSYLGAQCAGTPVVYKHRWITASHIAWIPTTSTTTMNVSIKNNHNQSDQKWDLLNICSTSLNPIHL